MQRAFLSLTCRPATVFRAGQPSMRLATIRTLTHSSRPNAPNVLKGRWTGLSAQFRRSSRMFMTDSAPVVSRPSQQEAWKRFGITAVRVEVRLFVRRRELS